MARERIGEWLEVESWDPPEGRKTGSHDIYSTKGHYLGKIKWYGAWRQYAFWPQSCTVFNKGCMEDLCKFLSKLNTEQRKKK